MEFHEIVASRYATRRFDGRPIPQEELESLLELIRLAPTSFNVQPWRVVVVSEAEQKQALEEAAWHQPQIASCSHLLVFCANTKLEELAERLEARMLAAAGSRPESVASYMTLVRDWIAGLGAERLAWAQRQTYLALGNGLNGAKSLGFDSCPMEGFQAEPLAEALGLAEHLVPTALLAIGYSADVPRPKLRFSRDEMFLTPRGVRASASSAR